MSHPNISESLSDRGPHRRMMSQASSSSQSSSVHLFPSELFYRSNISLNDSGVGSSPLTPRATVFTFDAVEIEQHIRESVSSVPECDEENEDIMSEDPELARIVNSFASISSNPSESERIRPSAPLNCLKKSDRETQNNGDHGQDDDDDDNDDDDEDEDGNNENKTDKENEFDDYEDDEDDDVFLNDFENENVDEEQQKINNYLLARINRVEHHLSLQYHRRSSAANVTPGGGNGRTENILRTRFGGLQIRCQRFVKRILGMAMPSSNQSSCASLTPFGIEREFIERMTVNAANNGK